MMQRIKNEATIIFIKGFRCEDFPFTPSQSRKQRTRELKEEEKLNGKTYLYLCSMNFHLGSLEDSFKAGNIE